MQFLKALVIACLILCTSTNAQTPKKLSSTAIHHELGKLNFLGTALYLAAHPDDENTRLISMVVSKGLLERMTLVIQSILMKH